MMTLSDLWCSYPTWRLELIPYPTFEKRHGQIRTPLKESPQEAEEVETMVGNKTVRAEIFNLQRQTSEVSSGIVLKL